MIYPIERRLFFQSTIGRRVLSEEALVSELIDQHRNAEDEALKAYKTFIFSPKESLSGNTKQLNVYLEAKKVVEKLEIEIWGSPTRNKVKEEELVPREVLYREFIKAIEERKEMYQAFHRSFFRCLDGAPNSTKRLKEACKKVMNLVQELRWYEIVSTLPFYSEEGGRDTIPFSEMMVGAL